MCNVFFPGVLVRKWEHSIGAIWVGHLNWRNFLGSGVYAEIFTIAQMIRIGYDELRILEQPFYWHNKKKSIQCKMFSRCMGT
jgi:hypothetical protein